MLQLTEGNLLGLDPVATDADQRAHLDQVIRAWSGRPDVRLVVKPIRIQGPETVCDESVEHDERALSTHDPTPTDRERVELRDRTCVHPHCNRPARLCDCDHITPFDEGGVTCPCNLAPLCRHHHRLKTVAGWRYSCSRRASTCGPTPSACATCAPPTGPRAVA